jgi:thiamine pyridinylase
VLIVFCAPGGVGSAGRQVELGVALFPYIPDAGEDGYAGLVHYLEQEFERLHPEVDLHLRPVNPADDFYDTAILKRWLTVGSGPTYDLVEVDAVLLGDLVSEGLIEAWKEPPGRGEWHPAAQAAVTFEGRTYGVPHLMCGHFIISRDPSVTSARSAEELVALLTDDALDKANLAGNFLGSWNMPALYLDAWRDTYPDRDLAEAISSNLDLDVVESLLALAELCEAKGKNPCLDGTYDDPNRPDLAAGDFSADRAEALYGYSERLHFVLRAADDDDRIHIGAAPFGKGNHQVVFVDAFVLRTEAPERVVRAARHFATFMNRAEIQEAVLMSLDVGSMWLPVPRYLIPATRSAFTTERIKNDRFYQMIEDSLKGAVPYPNRGLRDERLAMRDALLRSMGHE